MKVFLFTVLLLFGAFSLAAQETYFQGHWQNSITWQHGFILPHNPTQEVLLEGHTQAIRLDLTRIAGLEKDWGHLYNFPAIGLSCQYINLGNPEKLNYALTLFPVVHFPVLAQKPHLLKIRFGMGLGYVDQIYSDESNYKNLAIGSHLNGLVDIGADLALPTRSDWQLTLGLDFTHLSNGSIQTPNKGLNIPALNIGLRHFQGKAFIQRRDSLPSKTKSPIILQFSGAFAVKSLYPPGSERFAIWILSQNTRKMISRKSALNLGADLFMDESMEYRFLNDEDPENDAYPSVRFGLHGGYSLHMGRWNGGLSLGWYLYNPGNLDGSSWHRLGLQYRITPSIFAACNLKSHYAKADYFEWALGFQL